MSAEEMAAVAVAAAASLGQTGQVAGQATGGQGQAASSTEEQANTAGPWANEEDKPPSVLRAEIEALIVRNEFLERVANEQAQKIFLLEEHLRNQAVEMSSAVERVHIAETQAVRAREAMAHGGRGGVQTGGLVALAASIVPGGPSSARQLGAQLGQQLGIQFAPPAAQWPGDAQAANVPSADSNACWFHQNGGCSKGSKCPFKHEDGGGGGGGFGQTQNLKDLAATHEARGPLVLRLPGGGGGGGKADDQSGAQTCWHFVNEGKCEYGDKCRFVHPGVSGGGCGQPPPSAGGDSKSGAAPCWHFVNLGTCEYGDGCRFSHPAPGSTAANAPPMFLPEDGRPKRSRFTFDGPG